MKERPIITDLALQLDRLRQERDAVTQELNQERNRANDLERELSYRVADINRLRKEVEHLRAYLAEAQWESFQWSTTIQSESETNLSHGRNGCLDNPNYPKIPDSW